MKYARADFEGYVSSFELILDYLSDVASPLIAQRLLDEVNQQIEGTLGMPFRYPVYEYDQRFRKMNIKGWNYTVFYAVDTDIKQVTIYDIIHQSQDTPAILNQRFPRA